MLSPKQIHVIQQKLIDVVLENKVNEVKINSFIS